MIERDITKLIRERLGRYPAVVLVGPRQCGKTTLARSFGGRYFDCEVDGDVARLDAEWDVVVKGDDLVILDEIQEAPDIFRRLRAAIDADRDRRGRFLLLGSVAPALMQGVGESLAGRMGLIHLSPFVLPELNDERLDDLWLYGGFPDGGIRDSAMYPVWQQDYIEAIITRDLPFWGLTAAPRLMRRLAAMLGADHGSTFNAAQLGESLGIDHKTVQRYCDHLEGAFLIRRLPPWSGNIRKRLVRRPKVYWRDSGLLHGLMQVQDREDLYRKPFSGASWEGFVIEQTLRVLDNAGARAEPFFFCTSDGHELDLVLEWQGKTWAIEIKLTSNPNSEMIKRLHRVADHIDADRRVLVCRIAKPFGDERSLVCDLPRWLAQLQTAAAS